MSFSAIALSTLAAGTVISAIGAARQGRAAEDRAQAEAGISEEQAALSAQRAQRERVVSRQEEEDFRRDQSRLLAARRARLGATGVVAAEGSPLLVSEDFARKTELQALRLRAGGETRATRLEQQGQQQLREAGLFRASGRSARRGGFLRGGSLLLSGAGRAFGLAA